MSDDDKYPSRAIEERRKSGISLLPIHDGDDLYECHICGSVVSKWRTHVLWHEAQEPKAVRGEGLTIKHMRHYSHCNCLGGASECCDPNCECHQPKEVVND